MHKNVKGIVAKALALTLAVSVVGIQAPDAEAAKAPKLSTKKVTVAVKKSKTVKIKNVKAKKVKKLTVKSSKKKVATVKKSGKTAIKVIGKKAGKAKITVKVTLKGKKKATTLKLNVTVKDVKKPDVTNAPSDTATNAPVNNVTPTPSAGNDATAAPSPSAEATEAPVVGVTPAPNAGEKRITGKSDIENPIINNISIWGLRDNPYAETGYDYTQYGPFSGIMTKWYAPKDCFKAIHELFNPQVAQSVKSMKLMDTEGEESEEAVATPDAVGTVSDTSVTTTLTYISGPDDNQTVKNYTIDAVSRTSASNENQRVTIVDSETLAETGTTTNPAVKVSGRANNWHGVQFEITDFVTDPTKDYKLSMEIYHTNREHNSSQFYTQIGLVNADGSEDDKDRPTLVMQSAPANNWKRYAANFSINGYNFPRFIMYANWYGNTTTHDDFYVRNITIQEIYSENEYDTTDILAYSPLYENTEKKYGFSLGGVIGNSGFGDSNYKDVLGKHFSSMTIDNNLKMYSMLDQDATIANESGDGMPVLRKDGTGEEMVKWAYENGLGVRGHTIICDTAMYTNCKYFFHEDYDTTKPLASREVVLARMESFITQCITYFEEKYPGTIYTWDLVNEAISTTTGEYTTGDTKKIQIKDNAFYDTIGADYVEYAFLYGRKAVNALKEKYPERDINIQLFYNDFNCYEMKKRNAIVALVKSIQEFGQSQGMGNLIDGVGMQCYLGITGDPASKLLDTADTLLATSTKRSDSSIPNAIFMFNDLGCKVQITELTVRNYAKKGADETQEAFDARVAEQNEAQAEFYEKFMQMAIDINNGTITKVLE